MAISIEGLDPEAVAQIEEELVDALKVEFPSLDLGESRVLRELLIRPAAIFHVERQSDIDALRRSQSLLAIEQDPSIADDDIVDGILSNYRMTRNPGNAASGSLTIVLSALATTTIPQGTVFTAEGQQFSNDTTFIGVSEQAAVTNDQTRLIVARTNGSFAFTIPVTAVEMGLASQVRRNTRFTADVNIPAIVDIFATEDFTGGINKQTNQELIDQFKLGISPSMFSGRIQIEKLMLDTLSNIKDVSIIGFGDAEMIRDQHNIFGISQGGKADIFVRTQEKTESKTIVKTATLIDVTNKIWQLSLGRDDAPGFYLVEAVLVSAAAVETVGTLEITGETRGLDLTQTENEFVPDIANIIEGAYSRYQTAVIQFINPDTLASAVLGATQDYNVNVLVMPGIDTLNDVAIDRSTRNPQADYLVRAPVPAFCAIGVKVLYRSGNPVPDADAIKAEIVSRVNALKFEDGQLPASIVHDAVHNVAGSDVVSVSPLDFLCQIRKPDGNIITIRDADGIEIPNLSEEGVTSRTVAFFIDTPGVEVEVAQASVLPV
jgi:hypothetical protein